MTTPAQEEILRGYYWLILGLVVTMVSSAVILYAAKWLWFSSPAVPEKAEDEEVPDRNPWVDDMFQRTDISGRYRAHNAQLDAMVARGGMSRTVAEDARRSNATVFFPEKDAWTEVVPDSEIHSRANAKFNRNVTLSGV